MEKQFTLSKIDAEKQVGQIVNMTSEQIQALTADELLPLWYALCYMNADICIEHDETWGDFSLFVSAVQEKYESGIFSSYQVVEQLVPIRDHAGVDAPIEIFDGICEHCKENYLDLYESTSAYDLDGNDIQICETCREEDYRPCPERSCCAVYPNDAGCCPICGGGACSRRK